MFVHSVREQAFLHQSISKLDRILSRFNVLEVDKKKARKMISSEAFVVNLEMPPTVGHWYAFRRVCLQMLRQLLHIEVVSMVLFRFCEELMAWFFLR